MKPKLLLHLFWLAALPLLLASSPNLGAAKMRGLQAADKLLYADFETPKDNHPVSSRGGRVQLFAYQERPTLPSRYKGLEGANPPAPSFARLNKTDPNIAIAFDYDLQGLNEFVGVGVQVHGRAEQDGKPVADDVSGYKFLTFQLFLTGVPTISVEFVSQGQGIEMSSGYPQMSFKVSQGFNTYRVSLKSIKQPAWVETKVNPKEVLKKLTSINLVASCNQCTAVKGTVVIDNLVFEN
jgi:hypothetical protein